MRSLVLATFLALTGCATTRESYPTRTATEQMLISDAAEDAAGKLTLKLPEGRRCFLDITNFEGVDARYAVSAIRQHLMERGVALMETREAADTIIEVRAGALSIDSKSIGIQIPSLPITGLFPRIATPLSYNQWGRKTDTGVAKISAFAYDRTTGRLITVAETVVGESHRHRINGQQVVVARTPS